MESSFLDLAKDDKLGISPQDKYGNDKMIETIVKETYAFFAKRGRKSLFIFDNAEGYQDISKFLPLSLDNKPYILITSRNKDWGISENEGEIKTVKLGVFKETEALKFVKRALNIRNNLQDEEIKKLTQELQYFPLALGQAVAYINEKNIVLSYRSKEKIGVSDYLKEYEEEAEKLLDFESKYKSDRYTKTTFITWKITINAIAQKECGPEALNVLEIMAYLAPDKICIEEIFSKLVTDNEEKLWSAVELLDRYSIIDLKEGVASIHRLVQKVTELSLQKEGREEEVLRKALELINSGNVAQNSASHATSIWRYVSKHDKLIDDFYFDSTYGEYSSTPLHLLTENGNYKAIKAILTHMEEKYSDKFRGVINAKCEYSVTPLHLAAGGGWLNIVEYLIDKGANVDTRDYYYQTPLCWAVGYGKLDIVKYFIGKGANLDTEDWSCWAPLYWAVESENFDIAEYIMKEKGIDVGTRDSNGKTMLHEIVRFAKLDAIKYLIGKGIDINIKDGYGDTSLHCAAIRGKVDVVRYFVEQGADVNAKGNNDLTPLHWAVWYPNLKTVGCLVESGSDINAKSKDGWTSLHMIAKGNLLFLGDDFNEMLKVTEYLVQKGANIDVKNKDGNTPLHIAAEKRNIAIAKVLLKHNADINTKDEGGNTPLHLAAMDGKFDIAKILLKHNADVNVKNNKGMTALNCATDNHHQKLVELLLSHGAVSVSTESV